MKLKALMAITGLTLFALIASAPSFARTKAEIDASADKALSRFYTLNPKHKELVNKAAGILIFGRVTKGGAGVAGEFGEGVLRVNGKTVDYYSIGSASVGLTLGVAKHSKIIAFMTRDSLEEFTKSEGWSASLAQNVALVSKGAGDKATPLLWESRFSALSSMKRACSETCRLRATRSRRSRLPIDQR
jgi:lipid-binding SYLF domain-containing protein